VIAQRRATMISDELSPHCIWHSGPATIMAKTLALTFLPVFGLVRPHDLTRYHIGSSDTTTRPIPTANASTE
jgi:hypothetical protein